MMAEKMVGCDVIRTNIRMDPPHEEDAAGLRVKGECEDKGKR